MTGAGVASFSPAHAADVLAAARVWTGVRHADVPADELYRCWYAAPAAVAAWDPWWPPLGRLLRAGHAGSRSWTGPVRVARVGLAGTVVTRSASGDVRAHCRGDYVGTLGAGRDPVAGLDVRVLRRGGAHQVDGWWRTWGGGWSSTPGPRLSRLYLAPRTDSVVELVALLTRWLVDLERPWMLKCVAEPDLLGRPDAVVVYLPDDERESLWAAVARDVAGSTRPVRVPLTAPLGPGVGWAHEPGNGTSFGETRCRLLAAALSAWEATGAGPAVEADPDLLLEHVAGQLRHHGVDPAAPHARTEGSGLPEDASPGAGGGTRLAGDAARTSGDATRSADAAGTSGGGTRSGDAAGTSGGRTRSGDAAGTSGDAAGTSGDAAGTSGDAAGTSEDAARTSEDAARTSEGAGPHRQKEES
ncbi:T3SS effector HopA1 family protein [Auraticoccus monumenti]|uniref:Uncharacterized protein n=1 Tax=Auraticoccus monumenti TaxID=675864 RepID=A0A1G6TMN4_9ACTN|nr:T3SS effector HopA1 family protein [Auraticoccus monumenti]SDD30289.1 hypothetical protein SAMN04489747_0658 [Auraticoccus monumenti]